MTAKSESWLFKESHVYKPHRYPWAHEAWLAQQRMHWLPEEVPLADDVTDWRLNLTAPEKNLLTQIFRFFTQGDVEVGNCYNAHYSQVFKPIEVQMMLTSFSNQECFDDRTELLTSEGWKPCPEITADDLLAQYNLETAAIDFVRPDRVVAYDYDGVMHSYESRSTSICVTPNHDMIARHNQTGKVDKVKSYKRKLRYNYGFPSAGAGAAADASLVSDEERLLIAAAADAHIRSTCPSAPADCRGVIFNLKKERKIEKLRRIAAGLGLGAEGRNYDSRPEYTVFNLTLPEGARLDTVKDLGFLPLDGMSPARAAALVEEILSWDGSTCQGEDGSCRTRAFYSTNRAAVDKFQAICVLAGVSAVLGTNGAAGREVRLPQGGTSTNTRTIWTVTLCDRVWRTYPDREEVEYSGKVYCASVPHQNLVSRRNGRVAITGNTIHVAAYSHLLDTVGMPEVEYSAFLQYKEMKDKFDYMQGFSADNHHNLALTMAAFGGFTEGLQLFASFAMLLNFTRFGKMKGMGQMVAWSVRDESLHCDNVIRLYHTLLAEHPEVDTPALRAEVAAACRTIVEHEDAFVDLAFEMGPVKGMAAAEVKAYIRYVANRRLVQLGIGPIYDVPEHPLPWVDELMTAVEHSNFFENKSTEYSKAATKGAWDDVWARIAVRVPEAAE